VLTLRFAFDKMERFMPDTSMNAQHSSFKKLRFLSSSVRSRYGVFALAILVILGAGAHEHRLAAQATPAPQLIQPVLPSFSALVERVAPAVVSIRVKANPAAMTTRDDEEEESTESAGKNDKENNPFQGTPLERFFQGPMAPGQRQHAPNKRGAGAQAPVQGQGSGFFISADGYIVTNNHVVEGAISVHVVTDTGDTLQARIIGTDPGTDLALLKVEAGGKPFAFVPLGRSEVKPGDWVIAIGNPFGLGGTVTAGIVSARGRDIGMGAYDNFVQIDAAVNKGNSGGPAFNQAGEVIGVNTAIFSPSGGSAGIAFAIPAKTVESVVAQLQAKGRVTRGWLGVQVQPLTPELADSLGLKEAKGALVSISSPGSPAAAGGIAVGDVIVKIAGDEIKDNRDLARKIASIAPGSPVKIAVLRGGRKQTLEVMLAELKDEAKPELPQADLSHQIEIEPLGINVVPTDGQNGAPKGLAVLDINPAGKGADAGVLQGDIILNTSGKDIRTPADLEAALKSAHAAGKKHALAFIQRGTNQLYLALPADAS
jgi:serine protease Do